MSRVPVVAVINTSPDTVELLTDALEHTGFLVVSGFTYDIRAGKLDVDSFLRAHQPDVILYDLAPPYERNWRLLEHLRETSLREAQVVLTSTNARQAQSLAGADQQVYEIIGKPYDLDQVGRAVKEATRARPTR